MTAGGSGAAAAAKKAAAGVAKMANWRGKRVWRGVSRKRRRSDGASAAEKTSRAAALKRGERAKKNEAASCFMASRAGGAILMIIGDIEANQKCSTCRLPAVGWAYNVLAEMRRNGARALSRR
jgi:hypothetical protein